MHRNTVVKTVLLTLFLVAATVAIWEGFWRSKGFVTSYNDDKALWAKKRQQVYKPIDEATVFIGSSRIKFDLDIPTWKNYTGEDAVQLAIVGTSPLLLLKDLADDENFKGKLVVDITEVLFFSQIPMVHQSAKDAIEFYQKASPSEKFSASINEKLESAFVFLEKRKFSINNLLESLELPNRPGVFAMPAFPKTFEWTTADRQTYMPDIFLKDTAAINKQTNIWKILILGSPLPPVEGAALEDIFNQVKTAVQKIVSRGGKVIFVRTPSSTPLSDGEEQLYPRKKYWEPMLTNAGVPGIHYADFSNTKDFVCPEWSHLSRTDAVRYTKALARQLYDKNWFNGHKINSSQL